MAAGWRGLMIVAFLLAAFGFKGLLIKPPAAHGGEFQTDRALVRLRRILADERPHPVDSPRDDLVRDRIIMELRAIGLTPQVHEATDCSAMPKTRYVSCSHVHNLVATIPSLGTGRQLLLNAHYDSTPTGPGAGDDGLGVAVLLELAADLKASPPERPVTLLFNEGEEFGLNGAHAFVSRDPLAAQINSLINIDVRGVGGPALMYETSDPNRAAISVYAEAARRPYANSISTDFAKLIPNTTDVVFFKPRGWTLLNYGIIGNETRYHSPGDTVQALDRNSLAHVGREVLAATRTMAKAGNPPADAGRMVFTDIVGRAFIRLPLGAAAILLGSLLIASALLCWRRAALARPLAIVAGMTAGGIFVSAFVGLLLTVLRPGDFWRAYPLVSYLAIYSVLLLGMTAIQARFARGVERSQLRAAAWFLILLLGTVLSLALPGAAIFFLVAPTLAIAAIAICRRAPKLSQVLNLGAILLQLLMFCELLALVEMLLVDGPLWAVVPLAALVALPVLVEAEAKALRAATLGVALTSFGLSAAALALPRASAERPLGFSIDYFRDEAAKTASWAIATKQAPLPTAYPGNWHSGVLPYNGRTRWLMAAPELQTPVASAHVLSVERTSTGRRVRLALSPGGGNSVTIRFPNEAKVLSLGLAGAAIPLPPRGEPEKPLLRCTGRSCEGLQIEVLLTGTSFVTAELFSTRFGLPPEARPLLAARPIDAMPQYAPDQTITRSLVRI